MIAPRVVLGVAGASGAAFGLSVARQFAEPGAEIDIVTALLQNAPLPTNVGPMPGVLSGLGNAESCH